MIDPIDTHDPYDEGEPEWFRWALAQRPDTGEIEVDGCAIRYRHWSPATSNPRSAVVLLHGGAAHARWWDHVAPFLAADRPVVSFDLSGHGDSGRRDEYSTALYAHETVSVARWAAAGSALDPGGSAAAPPIVIGHSVGGMIALTAAHRYGDELGGVMAIDTPVRHFAPEERAARARMGFGPLIVYPSRDVALSRYRLVPQQPGNLVYVLQMIAETSIREYQGGWAWKFDPAVFGRDPADVEEMIAPRCRAAMFYAQFGLADETLRDTVYDQMGRVRPRIEIPAASHHVMIDHPLAMITGVRAVLAEWDHDDRGPSR